MRAHAALREIFGQFVGCFTGLLLALPDFLDFFDRFPGLPLQKEIQIPAHQQMRRQCNLMRPIGALHQELVQHAKCNLTLSPGTLVDGRSDRARLNLRNEIGE